MKFSKLVTCVLLQSGQIYCFLRIPSHLLGLVQREPLLFIKLPHLGHIVCYIHNKQFPNNIRHNMSQESPNH